MFLLFLKSFNNECLSVSISSHYQYFIFLQFLNQNQSCIKCPFIVHYLILLFSFFMAFSEVKTAKSVNFSFNAVLLPCV